MSVKNKTPLRQEWQILHQRACEQGLDSYIDPNTGYQVLTADFLKRRGYCCDSGCRHCPYGDNGPFKKKTGGEE